MTEHYGENFDYVQDMTDDEALRLFELEAKEGVIHLDYEAQYLDYKENTLKEEIDAIGGLRPPMVQRANLSRGLILTLSGSGLLVSHFSLGLWALEWLEMGPKAFVIAEFAVGLNPHAIITGTILEDEKVLGTVHIALGNNLSYGGTNDVPLHLDGVITRPTLYAGNELLIKDGMIVDLPE